MKFFNTFAKGGMLLAFLMLLSSAALAQRTVKGKLTDAETGEGLIGATVTVVGTTRGAVTDIDGNYSVEVPEGSTQLRFAYTGYAEQVVTLGASNMVEVALKAGSVLDEVVVVGYGTLKSKEVTSAVASLKSENFNKGNITSAAQLLQGKVAGVSISRPGSNPNGGFAIRLRGLSSLAATSPLFVVDGVPGISLNLIDPNDIESIDILKDGSAAAIYGTRASAGVVIITTKKGAAGRTTVEYNGQTSIETVAKRYNTLDAARFVAAGGTDLSPEDPAAGTDTDWFDEITQNGRGNIHNISMSGGMGSGSYRASFNYRQSEGILLNSGFDQYNGSLNFTQKAFNNRLTFNGNLAATNVDREYSFSTAFRYAITGNPTSKVKSDDPLYAINGGYVEKDLFDYLNALAIVEQNFDRAKESKIYGNLKTDFEIVKGFVASLTLSQERGSLERNQFFSKQSKFNGGQPRNGRGSRNNENFVTNLLELTGNYTLKFGKSNDLKLLGGYSWQGFDYDGFGIGTENIISNELSNSNLGAYLGTRNGVAGVGSYNGNNRLIAFFGRASLNIDDTYFATVGLRREGSTRFGPDNKWGLFPFVSAGMNLEKLLNVSSIDQLKVRVGYGVTGSQPNQNSLYRQTYVPGAAFFYNGAYVPSYGPNRNPNPALKWEEKGEFNFGVDFNLFGYKVGGALDIYDRTTEDLILALTVPVPPNLVGTTFDNVGAIQNRGVELTLNFNNIIDKERLKWTPGLVFNRYKTTLKEFTTNDTLRYANVGSPGQNGVFYTIVYPGAPLGQLWGPIRESVTSDGKVTYKDIDGNGVVTTDTKEAFNQDQTQIGNGTPKFELGFNNSLVVGNFDLNLFFRGVVGHDLVNEYRVFYENLDPTASTWNKVDTKFFNPNLKAQNRFDDTHVENASFLRLDNATLGYNFRLPSSSWFNKARVFVNGQNLFTITKYTGVDPEPRAFDDEDGDGGGDPLAPGIDRRVTFFLARTFSFGVNFGF